MKKISPIYEDDHILVVDKPSGLQVHPQKGFRVYDTLVGRLAAAYENPPSPVHRLDRPTSGVLLLGFSSQSLSFLCQSFREREVKKTYRAIVRGWIDEEGEIDIPLKKQNCSETMDALTHFRRIATAELPFANNRFSRSRYSLAEITPETGRFHQIRRHLARIGHPIPGDTSHGDTRHNHLWQENLGVRRLMLHAWKLEFPHPDNGKIMEVAAPLPELLNEESPLWQGAWRETIPLNGDLIPPIKD